MKDRKLSYQQAGVDIDKGNQAVDIIKQLAKSTENSHVVSGIGGFGGLFTVGDEMDDPVLIATTDGVGTKLKLAFQTEIYHTIGEDLVAMCVNDLLAQGGKPLIFLDYLAMGSLDEHVLTDIMTGIVNGCNKSSCSLLGGETAEMPGFYGDGEFELAGFSVGAVDRQKIIDGCSIAEGDVLIGLPSSGIHSNGYSLARKVLLAEEGGPYQLSDVPPGFDKKLGEVLLEPTRIYVPVVLPLLKEVPVKGAAHITGGGLIDNLPRILPDGLRVDIDINRITEPKIFSLIKEEGNVDVEEMRRTFNMGVGFVLVVSSDNVDKALRVLQEQGEEARVIGEVKPNDSLGEQVNFND